MAKWMCWSAPALPMLAGCLLADVSVDENFQVDGVGGTGSTEEVGSLQGGTGGTGPMAPVNNVSSPLPEGTPTCMRTVPDVNTYRPDKERACGDYCTLYTCICAGQPANKYTDTFDCLDTCIDSDWPIGSLSTIEPGTVTCRFWHAGLALTQGVTPHCYHAAEVPTQGGCQILP